ncbi:MAG: hypothetical protein ACLFQV_09445, partial [Vulcanimicrobiota bacterium]
SHEHQNFRRIINNLEIELKNSNIDTITFRTDSGLQAVSFLSAYDENGAFVTNADCEPVWQKYVVHYSPANSSKLYKKDVYGSFTNAMTLTELNNACNGGNVVIDDMNNFKINLDSAKNMAHMSLTLTRKNDNGKIDEITQNFDIKMRN